MNWQNLLRNEEQLEVAKTIKLKTLFLKEKTLQKNITSGFAAYLEC